MNSQKQQFMDFVEYYGGQFDIPTVIGYTGISEVIIKRYLAEFIKEGLVKKIKNDLYVKHISDPVKEKKMFKLVKKYEIERLRSLEQARVFREKLNTHIKFMRAQWHQIDQLIKEMEEVKL